MFHMQKIGIYTGAILLLGYVLSRLGALLAVGQSTPTLLMHLLIYFGVPILFGIMLTRPEVSGRILLFCFVMDFQIIIGGTITTLLPFVYTLALLALVAQSLTTGGGFLPRHMRSPLWIIYLSIALLRFGSNPVLPTWGHEGISGARAYASFFTSFIPYAILPAMFPREKLKELPWTFLWISLVALLLKYTVFLTGLTLLARLLGVTSSTALAQEHRLTFLSLPAQYLFIAALTLLLFVRRPKGSLVRIFLLLLLMISTFALLMTGTRGIVFAAICAAAFAMSLRGLWVRAATIGGAFILLIFIASNTRIDYDQSFAPVVRAVSVSFMSISDRTAATTDFLSMETFHWRTALWREALASIKRHPVSGRGLQGRHSGLTTWQTLDYASFVGLINQGELDSGATHNILLGPFLSFGIPAGLLFLAYVFRRSRSLLSTVISLPRTHSHMPLAAFLATWLVFALSATLTTGGTVAPYLFLLMAFCHEFHHNLHAASTDREADGALLTHSDSNGSDEDDT